MRILYYNWVDYRDPAGRGGGVSLYQRMLMEEMAAEGRTPPIFLCAGLAHTLRPGRPRWAPLRHGPAHEAGRRFTLIDSHPLSPSHHSFGSAAQIDHPETVAAFADFVAAHGPFDIVHFNNLEGVPARVLALREAWPATRFVVSLHNYYPFCPQVNLWHREDSHCDDFEGGAACVACLPFQPDPRQVRLANAAAHTFDGVGLRPGVALFDHVVQPAMRAAALSFKRVAAARRARPGAAPVASTERAAASREDAARFAARRAEMVTLLNAYADRVIAVSDRTAQIARGFGVSEERLEVLRIGTDHAPLYGQNIPPHALPRADGTLKLAYLGYMRRDKGFYFLLDALEALPAATKARLHILIAARSREPETLARMRALAPHFAEFIHLEGYARDGLDALLTGVDLGVVPVLWEDNLPQVALELHARRIPLLTSDRGGAQELRTCPALTFAAGDKQDFADRLQNVLDGGLDLGPYWTSAIAPITPNAHVTALLRLYGGLVEAQNAPNFAR